MKLLINLIMRAPNYWRSFGFVSGSRLLLKIEGRGSSTSDRTLKINMPNDQHPVYLRDQVSDRSIFWQVLVQRQYRMDIFPHFKAIQSYYHAMVAKGKIPLIIDGGANIGLASRFYATTFPKAKIIAVEPSSANFEMLVKNTRILGDKVVPVNGGIWPNDTYLKVVGLDKGAAGFQVVETEETDPDRVKAYSINSLMELGGRDSVPFIVKLDIEGSQKHLFEQKADWIDTMPVISLELEDWLFPWSNSSTGFFTAVSRIPADYLLSGENIVWINHTLQNTEQLQAEAKKT